MQLTALIPLVWHLDLGEFSSVASDCFFHQFHDADKERAVMFNCRMRKLES